MDKRIELFNGCYWVSPDGVKGEICRADNLCIVQEIYSDEALELLDAMRGPQDTLVEALREAHKALKHVMWSGRTGNDWQVDTVQDAELKAEAALAAVDNKEVKG